MRQGKCGALAARVLSLCLKHRLEIGQTSYVICQASCPRKLKLLFYAALGGFGENGVLYRVRVYRPSVPLGHEFGLASKRRLGFAIFRATVRSFASDRASFA